jgi:hypothetical protein
MITEVYGRQMASLKTRGSVSKFFKQNRNFSIPSLRDVMNFKSNRHTKKTHTIQLLGWQDLFPTCYRGHNRSKMDNDF